MVRSGNCTEAGNSSRCGKMPARWSSICTTSFRAGCWNSSSDRYSTRSRTASSIRSASAPRRYMAEQDGIRVQVCYATPARQYLQEVTLPAGSTLHDAVKRSGILQQAPEIDLSVATVGIFGKRKTLETVMREGDRVEIYRPLLADPKESRR